MSDLSAEEQRELIENAKSRDQRLALIEQSLDVESELRDSPTWRYIMHRIELEKADIATAFADVSPADLSAVAKLQARAISAASIKAWLFELVSASAAAEDQINIEDGRAPADQ